MEEVNEKPSVVDPSEIKKSSLLKRLIIPFSIVVFILAVGASYLLGFGGKDKKGPLPSLTPSESAEVKGESSETVQTSSPTAKTTSTPSATQVSTPTPTPSITPHSNIHPHTDTNS